MIDDCSSVHLASWVVWQNVGHTHSAVAYKERQTLSLLSPAVTFYVPHRQNPKKARLQQGDDAAQSFEPTPSTIRPQSGGLQ
jgi:hypothetical protein